MEHPKKYLLDKIVGYNKNGFDSLGKLNACHINDISEIMKEYAIGSINEFIESINNGESVDVDGKVYSLKKIKRK